MTFIAGATIGYHAFGYSWVGALYMTVITVGTVGYGEQTQASTGLQLFTIAVIVTGVSLVGYVFGGAVRLMTEGEINRALRQRQRTQGIQRLSGHTVVCGYGRMGETLACALAAQKHPFVVVDASIERIAAAEEQGYLVLQGDATDDSTLLEANVRSAGVLATCLSNDAANVFITLTARNFCPNIRIIARAEQQSTAKKLRQAGANQIVLPTIAGAHQVVRSILRPNTANLMEVLGESQSLQIDMDEMVVADGSPLCHKSVRETHAHRDHQILFLAIKRPDGELVFSPSADSVIAPDDTLILVGTPEKVVAFRQKFASAAGGPSRTRPSQGDENP